MEYLVMECHTSYAVVLDSRGQFKKVANLHYEVGQELAEVVELREPKREKVLHWRPLATAAACLCILITGLWQMVLLSMGTVLIQINPQVRLSVNRMERVISAEAVNPDGAKLLFDYHPFGKTVEQVTGELSDRAAQMGYLTDGGEVHLTVDSADVKWRSETEHRLEAVIVHDAKNITVIIELDDDRDEDWDDPDEDDWDDDDRYEDEVEDDLPEPDDDPEEDDDPVIEEPDDEEEDDDDPDPDDDDDEDEDDHHDDDDDDDDHDDDHHDDEDDD